MSPAPRFPYSSGIAFSRHSHRRELWVQHAGRPYHILYAFNPRRTAILLIGGEKTGDDRWYETVVPLTNIWPTSRGKVNGTMAKHVKDLQAKMSPESRARSEAKTERLIREMALEELRAAHPGAYIHLARPEAHAH